MKNKLLIMFSFTLLGLLIMVNPLKADEVIVPEGPEIFNFIAGDTTSTGERNVPGRIYKLERGKLYIFTETLEVDFDFYLVAEEDDPNNPVRPPMLVRGVHPDGSMVNTLIYIAGDGINVELRNLLFQGVPLDGKYKTELARAVGGNGSDVRLSIDKCVFNGWTRAAVQLRIPNIKLFVTNNYFRNLVMPVHPFHGQSVTTYSGEDTLIYTNNTLFNTSSYIVLTNPGMRTNYLKFDHNTIFTTIVNPFYVPAITNAEFTNNVFYGVMALGQRQQEITAGWYGWDNIPAGIMNYDTLTTDLQNDFGINESERKIIQKNNVWFTPQKYEDYWSAFIDSVAITDANGDTTGYEERPLTGISWMNDAVQSMFDDDANYPNLIDEGNMNEDPQYDQTMSGVLVDSVVSWVSVWRGSGLGFSASEGPARQYDFTSDIFNLPWPLPETPLTYNNANLSAASTEGLHLGDLNWYPEDLNIYTDVQINTLDNLPVQYSLSDNYPNPFNPSTNIEFSIPQSGKVTLKVFNLLGEEVAELINKDLGVGTYKINFDADYLTSGIYFYTLSSNNFVQTKKMLLLK